MNQTTRLLTTITSTEPMTWREFCFAIGDDLPGKGVGSEWRLLFEAIEVLEQCALVEVRRRDGKIEQLQLTKLGAERAREALKGQNNGF